MKLPGELDQLKNRYQTLLIEIHEKQQRINDLRTIAAQKALRDQIAEIKPTIDSRNEYFHNRSKTVKEQLQLFTEVKGNSIFESE